MTDIKSKSRFAIGVALALALLTILLGAAPPPAPSTTTFNLTNVIGESLAGVYTSPYLGNVGGATIPVICDDFSDNSYLPESWTTYVTSLNTINSSSTPLSYLKWKGANSEGTVTVPGVSGSNLGSPTNPYAAWDLTQSEAYTVAAILTLDILELNHPANPPSPVNNNPGVAQQQEDYSFALWELFDPNATAGGVNANWGSNTDSVVPWLSGSYAGDLNSATQDLEAAINTSASALNGYTATIYSYVGPPTGTTPECGNPLSASCASTPPQEFITLTPAPGTTYITTTTMPVPEPSSPAILGVYVLCGGGCLLFFGRRRVFRNRH